YRRPVPELELAGAVTDPETGVVSRPGLDGSLKPIGLRVGDAVYRGFQTPSRKLQIYNPLINEMGEAFTAPRPPLPAYIPIPAHRLLGQGEFVLTSFKWNVHTQSRTMNQPWLAEIVHDNPVWINAATAAELGIADGDRVAISALPRPLLDGDGARAKAPVTLEARAYLTEGIHPQVVAISASFGHSQYGPVAQGHGYNPNPLIPSVADPVGGGQAWNDTVVSVRHLGK
ncbi:MAG: hypothetical protein JWN15_3869, partial [Firmicutes bacterium]|nr:hypothetical protein [Bacillota bacterium]